MTPAPRAPAALVTVAIALLGCDRAKTDPTPPPASSAVGVDAPVPQAPPPVPEPPLPAGSEPCSAGGRVVSCTTFKSPESAFQWVLAHEPLALGVGEAHAQRGTERIPSAARRFTESLLPIVAEAHGPAEAAEAGVADAGADGGTTSVGDLLVEAWAPDARCQKEVKETVKAQAPVKAAQAKENPNEYVAMGTKAKALGITPHLLRPSCDDFAAIADAGADAIPVMLGTIQRVTVGQAKRLLARNEQRGTPNLLITYGGAIHNDLFPTPAFRRFSFGPDLAEATKGRYIALDLIVREYIKDDDTWSKLPWYGVWKKSPPPSDRPALYKISPPPGWMAPPGARIESFVLLFPAAPGAATGALPDPADGAAAQDAAASPPKKAAPPPKSR